MLHGPALAWHRQSSGFSPQDCEEAVKTGLRVSPPPSQPASGAGSRRTHLLGGLVPIVLLSPELRLHLELDILKVHAPVHRLEVAFGHVVGGALPLLGVQKVGEFLPGEKDKGEPVYNSAGSRQTQP